jgi:hypothetical protein
MDDLDYLEGILKSSYERHGEKPLTNRWLMNIVRMAIRNKERNAMTDDWDYLTIDDIM